MSPELKIGPKGTKKKKKRGFARGSPRSVFMAFYQPYIEHDLKKKKKIVIPFFC
jgi:hypothetical protein